MSNASGKGNKKQSAKAMEYKIKKIQLKKASQTQESKVPPAARQAQVFGFDQVFAAAAKTEQIYIAMVRPIVDRVLTKGVNGAVFMYG